MQSPSARYIDKLDHLRFFAALLVLMFHVELLSPRGAAFSIPMIREGHSGVGLFMVISGFILTVIAQGRPIELRAFYVNRALRIYPVFALVVALGYFATPDPRPSSATLDFLVAMLPVSNISRMSYGMYGGHFWSIAVELQFYLVFPVVALCVARRGAAWVAAAIGFAVLLRLLVLLSRGSVHQLAYFSIFGALDAFLVGMVCGCIYVRGLRTVPLWWSAALLVLLNLALWGLFRGDFFHVDWAGGRAASPSWLWVVWPTIQALLFGALVLAYVGSAARIPLGGVLAALGRYSYSIYAWHILVVMLVVELKLGWHPYLTGALTAALVVPVAAASYHLVEKPFLRLRHAYTLPATG
jgi:peptidoglycan/LPS O-acetylase OafA/YrhL